ncbi:MAG: DUF1214 domain-containing protein [Rhizobiales bacterium]|nr:DUF1214 domain-containing protein [Hyphomicrobiales bacterium]
MRPQLLVRILLVLAIGAGLGFATSWAALRNGVAFDLVAAGPWVAAPRLASRARDPYAAAALARAGETPFDLAEGLVFVARADASGAKLDGACVYRVKGPTPPARFWTLTLTDQQGRLVENEARRYGFTSTEIVREETGGFEIVVAPTARAGAWLPAPADRRFALTLRLYDTPSAAAAATLQADALPQLLREQCL